MIRSDKLASIGVTKATVVASANPGCSLWLAGDGLDLRHPMQIIDTVLHGDSARHGEQRRSKRTTEVADE